jgi:excisionase family DNA binding protein
MFEGRLNAVIGDDEVLLTADEVARPLKVSAAFVRILAARGELGCVRLGRAVRFKPADVRAFIEANSVRPAGGPGQPTCQRGREG